MQTVQLFDGVSDHGFTISDITPSHGGFEVVVQGDGDAQQHRLSVHPDGDGSFLVAHGSSPAVQVGVASDRYADQIRVTLAGDGEDVSGHAAVPVLHLTGTVSDDDDVSGHLNGRDADSTLTLAAAGACMLIRQLPASDAAQRANG